MMKSSDIPANIFPALHRPVTRLGFGAMGLGGVAFGKLSDVDAVEAVLHALESGITFIDTARGYGRSEELIGKALKEWHGETPVIATKVPAMGTLEQYAIPQNVEQVFPRGHIRSSAETSLKTLGLEKLDLMQLHLYWPNWGTEGYWLDELQQLKQEGLVGAVGVSLPDQRCDVGLPLVQTGLIDAVQVVFNLFDPQALDCLIPMCHERGIAVIARCILDEGGLTGTLKQGTIFAEGDYRRDYFDYFPRSLYLERVERLKTFIPEHASSLTALALKYVLHHPGVTTAISSMHVKEHCDANIAALSEPSLSEEAFTELRYFHRFIRNFYAAKVFYKS